MVSPKKFSSSSRLFASQNGTHHETSDIPRLEDVDSSGSLNFNLDGSLCLSKHGTSRSEKKEDNNWSGTVSEDSGSYLQVIVKKHHGKKEVNVEASAVQTSPPAIPGPYTDIKHLHGNPQMDPTRENNVSMFKNFDSKNPGIYMMPHPMVFGYPMYEKAKVAHAATSISLTKAEEQPVASDTLKEQCGLPKLNEKASNTAVNSFWKEFKWNTKLPMEAKQMEKTEVYYFETNKTGHLSSTDSAPVTSLDRAAAKADNIATRFWAEVFSPFYILLSFLTSFVVQMQRFVLVGLFRPLIIDSIQMWSDYGLKPTLTLIYNALVHPPMLFIQNSLVSLQHAVRPLTRLFADCMRPANNLVRAFRLVNISKKTNTVRSV